MKYFAIAGTEGPFDDDRYNGCLTIDKSYEIIKICNIKTNYQGVIDGSFNPDDTSFYIRVIDDRGVIHDIWNDYFYSTAELREIKLNNLLT